MDYDALEEIEKEFLPDQSDPNGRYDASTVKTYTINSITDANQFCNTYNHDNNYSKNGNDKLRLGDRIQINDGTYNKAWIIAGFDMEANNIADDGRANNNGYGICLIPETYVTTAQWDTKSHSNGYGGVSSLPHTSYLQSTIHTSTLPTVANKLKNVLGNHLINRNVLLGSRVNLTLTPSSSQINGTNSYTWTTAYCTLMSPKQLYNEYFQHYERDDNIYDYSPNYYYSNKYDDGEANYYLPIFNHKSPCIEYQYWTRAHAGVRYRYTEDPDTTSAYYEMVWFIYQNSTVKYYMINPNWDIRDFGVRPMIYIR